jgi:hypothetical protein
VNHIEKIADDIADKLVDRFMPTMRRFGVEQREAAFREALRYAGYLPQSIDLAVVKNRDWIEGKR